jgi:hypothetical protein
MELVFLKNLKVAFKSFKKIGKKNLDVDTYEIYYSAKNQCETRYILASAKMTNLPKFQTLKPGAETGRGGSDTPQPFAPLKNLQH